MNVRLLKDLDFSAKINSKEAVTEAGKELLKNYRAYCYSNAPTCGIVNGFVAEASNFSFDTGLINILESVKAYINENNITWKLASTCEGIINNNSSQSYISKFAVENVQKLVEMKEEDAVSYIKGGVLKNVQYVPEFRNICKEVYKSKINESQAVNYTVTNPISYVYVDENKNQFFTVSGKVFKISDGKTVEESVCDNKNFNRINTMLLEFKKDNDNIFFEMASTHGDKMKFTLSNEDSKKLTFEKGSIKESFDKPIKFMEYSDMISKTMSMNERMIFMNVSKNISDIFENLDNIVVLDCVKYLQCNNGTNLAIIEAKDNVNLTVFQSINAGKSSNTYDYMVEALNNVTKLTGIDLKFMFEDRINEDCKKAPEYNEVTEQLNENMKAQMDIRKKKIAMLAERYKDDPLRLSLLSAAAKQLNVLED